MSKKYVARICEPDGSYDDLIFTAEMRVNAREYIVPDHYNDKEMLVDRVVHAGGNQTILYVNNPA